MTFLKKITTATLSRRSIWVVLPPGSNQQPQPSAKRYRVHGVLSLLTQMGRIYKRLFVTGMETVGHWLTAAGLEEFPFGLPYGVCCASSRPSLESSSGPHGGLGCATLCLSLNNYLACLLVPSRGASKALCNTYARKESLEH